MDHIPSLPRSYKGNTELLIWVDLFTGYVIAKATASRTAQTIAENYEECIFRRFGASEAIQHDREPGFMSDFSAPSTAEWDRDSVPLWRTVHKPTLRQNGWTGTSTRNVNTAYDRIRGETPFYLVQGWDARSTLEAIIPLGSTRRWDVEPRWRKYKVQRQYQQARKLVNEALHDTIEGRAKQYNEDEGYARKLAHMWHGPFRVAETVDRHAVRLETAGTEYRLFPIIHVSKLKLVKCYAERPTSTLTNREADRVDFDEGLLPEGSWERELEENEYEVERITDKGYDEPSWVDDIDLNCGALLRDFDRGRTDRNRFEAMQSHKE
ncbi:hypothetical protein L916_21769 [Phytophthora nicotianae]|uniref:Integrase catalytic domain-containing protein n=1 Tax=Phytophthora nicotianae TaxID=4792 RepID=W2HSV3_PHYNI|nr:hypothetical protein L916_21769 [Phytophthora nicotianae]